MLQRLHIRNIVLIESLDVQFGSGLCCLTGETGSGKSVLLDALGLALGGRAEARLLRKGAQQGSVVAEFDISDNTACRALLEEYALPDDQPLVIRRQLQADGKNRAFISDVPVGVQLLRDIGETLLEVHGQHAQRGLLDSRVHREILDRFGGLLGQAGDVSAAYRSWRKAEKDWQEKQAALQSLGEEEEYLRHVLQELDSLAPEMGEEDSLASRRQRIMQGEKLAGNLQSAMDGLQQPVDVTERLATVERSLIRLGEEDQAVQEAADLLAEALDNTARATECLERLLQDCAYDPREAEEVEARLFALRAAARKHHCQPDMLPEKRQAFAMQLAQLEHGEQGIAEAEAACHAAQRVFMGKAEGLSAARKKAAVKLEKRVEQELAPLKLERARFEVSFTALDADKATAQGLEDVAFHVATNPGSLPGPLAKIASGGELSRLMLALNVALAETDGVPSMVFDEIDTGVGGAVAEAIGKRLALLGEQRQVFVVTHQPQVAALATQHYKVWKDTDGTHTHTYLQLLDDADRREELARMLAGERITDQARAAADSLLVLAEG